jgi:hypothetical protein
LFGVSAFSYFCVVRKSEACSAADAWRTIGAGAVVIFGSALCPESFHVLE